MNDPIIHQIVARCHVGESYLAVAEYVVSRMINGRAGFLALPRETRRAVLANIFAEHRKNRELYDCVMKGKF